MADVNTRRRVFHSLLVLFEHGYTSQAFSHLSKNSSTFDNVNKAKYKKPRFTFFFDVFTAFVFMHDCLSSPTSSLW